MKSTNDQNFFNIISNNNFKYNTIPIIINSSYDVELQQNAISTNWLINDFFYEYEQMITRQKYLDLA